MGGIGDRAGIGGIGGDRGQLPNCGSRTANCAKIAILFTNRMARMARVVAAGVPHHITQRGNNRQDVFLLDDDRRFYLGGGSGTEPE